MRSLAQFYGAVIESGAVDAVERQGNLFHVTSNHHVETARNVIFASGVFNHRPPLSIEDHDRVWPAG